MRIGCRVRSRFSGFIAYVSEAPSKSGPADEMMQLVVERLSCGKSRSALFGIEALLTVKLNYH
jgi:hypothetical protein